MKTEVVLKYEESIKLLEELLCLMKTEVVLKLCNWNMFLEMPRV